MRNGRKEAAKRLYEIAESQQGFFTTKQAKAAGFVGILTLTTCRRETGFVSIGESTDWPAFRAASALT
jgi:hypothetical protein